MPKRFATALCLAGLLALCGCGGSSNSASTTSSSAASTATRSGSVGSRDGSFTTVIPSGFADASAALAGGPVNILYAAVRPVVNGFRTNINVVRESSHGITDVDTAARRELAGLRRAAPAARSFSSLRALTLGGAPARGIDYVNRPQGRLLHQSQAFVIHGNWIYIVTYTALPSDYGKSLGAWRTVLANWRWR
jgi:hypothetical protein